MISRSARPPAGRHDPGSSAQGCAHSAAAERELCAKILFLFPSDIHGHKDKCLPREAD